jgi:hypothetical protein
MNEKQEKALDKLHETSELLQDVFDDMEKEQEEYWNSLTKEQQLLAFCAVCRRILKGDIVDKGTYRYVLYDVFGFGPEAYLSAQLAGYMAIHNSIFTSEQEFE